MPADTRADTRADTPADTPADTKDTMTDSYYELIDDANPLGEKFTATDLVRSTWSAAIQHAAPVSALLVRALERCKRRDDTRLSRVVVDLLGPVPAEGDCWVRADVCLLYTSPSPRDRQKSRMPSSA